jgi:hypothetical protein
MKMSTVPLFGGSVMPRNVKVSSLDIFIFCNISTNGYDMLMGMKLKLIISTAFVVKASFTGIASPGHQFVKRRYTWMKWILILKAAGGLGPFK